MSQIKGKNTNPELRVRSFLHRNGFRFRLHRNDLPGKPDIVLPKYNTVIFVHGCFWHRHKNCRQGLYFPKDPKQGIQFWEDKFSGNVKRDRENKDMLENAGWTVLVVWECETKTDAKIRFALKELIWGEKIQ
jgi:DNA mismatch endonuclease (patch repair protein)